uniref:Aspartate dehydrogenase domain-containing protein n=1 Tax=Ditylenchus dipsaci TaxID=166011 RepID=A0A915CSP5_9BILA
MDLSQEEKQGDAQPEVKGSKRIGIIGYGHLGQFLRIELSKSPSKFTIKKIWNRTEEEKENVLPLTELNESSLADIDLVIEVAHPDVIHEFGKMILGKADLFIGSPTALATQTTLDGLQERLIENKHRSVFVPSGALWGANDIQRMANLGILKGLTITMLKHPSSLKVADSLKMLCQRAIKSNMPVVLYDGPVRLLCPLAPNNVNTMAAAAIAAHTLGFENTRAKLIADPALLNWHIIEYELEGENGFRTTVRRENPAQAGAVTGDTTYFSFLSSVREALYKPLDSTFADGFYVQEFNSLASAKPDRLNFDKEEINGSIFELVQQNLASFISQYTVNDQTAFMMSVGDSAMTSHFSQAVEYTMVLKVWIIA